MTDDPCDYCGKPLRLETCFVCVSQLKPEGPEFPDAKIRLAHATCEIFVRTKLPGLPKRSG